MISADKPQSYLGEGRVYGIIRTLVYVIVILAGMSAVYYGYMIGSDSIQNEWKGYCAQYTDMSEYTNCMMLSGKLIAKFKRLLWINVVLAVGAPSLFAVCSSLCKRKGHGAGS